MKERNRMNYIKSFKIAIGAAISIIIANLLQLSFGTAAGIITLLSVQNTKKETLVVAGRRILAFILAMILAWITFSILGYSAGSFGAFLFVFVLLCELFGLQEGIPINSVLTTHFLTFQVMGVNEILNEFLLLIIGISVGALTNVYIPRNVKEIKRSQRYIEERLRQILEELSVQLCDPDKRGEIIKIQELHLYIQHSVRLAYENHNNTFLADTQYFIEYMELRLTQLTVIERIYSLIQRLDYHTPQATAMAAYLMKISMYLHETNDGTKLLKEFEELRQTFEQGSMPAERIEFENRAILFQVLWEVEWFLQLKIEFSKHLTKQQIEEFWS